MSGPEFRVACEWLGLNLEAASERLGVNVRTAARWGYGHREIPEGVAEEVRSWLREAAEQVADYVEELRRVPPPPRLVTYRSDDEFHAYENSQWPASWHRAIARRVLQEIPDLVICYPDDLSKE